MKKCPAIHAFKLVEGQVLAGKYEVRSRIGTGWEGEVYLISEVATGIERAAKLFFPRRNLRNQTAKHYARKLHKLRHCSILIHYMTQEFITVQGRRITMLISEYVEGELLSEMIKHEPGRRLAIFEGLHLLHALAAGVAEVHLAREYHGDLHSDNIIVRRYGIGFEIKLIDLFHRHSPKRENIQDDVCDLIRLFYDAIGGARHYATHCREVKAICCGLKRTLILKKFRNAGHLRDYLENMRWDP